MILRRVLFTLSAVSLVLGTGCVTNSALYLDYTTQLVNEDRSGPLLFEDDRFAFSFEPSRSGVQFEIRNLTSERARLLWDGTYFVEPGGNTFRALNTDILRERSEIVSKAQYASIIAPKSSLRRFTTSSIAATGPNALELRAAVESLQTTRVSWNTKHQKWDWAGEPSQVLNRPESQISLPEVSWRVAEHWPAQIKPEEGQSIESALRHLIDSELNGRERIGLGFQIEQAGEKYEYHFDFEIAAVFAFQLVSHSEEVRSKNGMLLETRHYWTQELRAILRQGTEGWSIELIAVPEAPVNGLEGGSGAEDSATIDSANQE